MTDEKRIEILEKVKEFISKNEDGLFICPMLERLNNNSRDTYKEAIQVFPELIKHKPKDKSLHSAWWAGNEKKPRIKVLNSMIKEIKAKSNG